MEYSYLNNIITFFLMLPFFKALGKLYSINHLSLIFENEIKYIIVFNELKPIELSEEERSNDWRLFY